MEKTFASYGQFKDFLWNEYRPLEVEKMEAYGFKPGAHWASRNGPRFYRMLKTLETHVPEAGTIVDVGAFPGSFSRLMRHCYGPRTRVSACGLPNVGGFEEQLKTVDIEFRGCNIDPDIVTEGTYRLGLPYENESVDLIVCLEVVEHLYSVKLFMEECARVLKKGGHLLITTDNIKSRAGLLRLLKNDSTNLDEALEETSIWSDHKNQWRGHVRFFSLKQLAQVGELVGLRAVHAGRFEQFTDPDSYEIKDSSPLAPLRKLLRGNGERPPIRLRERLESVWHLGWRSLSSEFDNRIEVLLRK